MREILFKAKEKYDRDWIEGFLSMSDGEYVICGREGIGLFIDESTICQYTGLTDNNGNKIFENDVVYIPREDEYFKVEWNEDTASFVMNGDGVTVTFDNYWSHEVEVYGSAFDIGELLGGGE